MAVDMRSRGTVGCAYYVAMTETLHFMKDVKLGSIETVEHLKLHIQPTIVVVSTRTDEQMMRCLHGNDSEETSGQGLPYVIQQVPKVSFDYESGKQKLGTLNIGEQQAVYCVPGDLQAQPRPGSADESKGTASALSRLAGWIELDSEAGVGCAGAVIAYVRDRRQREYLDTDPAAQDFMPISYIELFTLDGTMMINDNTLSSLQIMQSEAHPHQHRQGPTASASGSKEALSVYGLFQHFVGTAQGTQVLQQYFLRPCLNRDILRERHDVIEILTHPENRGAFRELVGSMKGIKNIRKLLINVRQGISGGTGKTGKIAVSTWAGLRGFAFCALSALSGLEEMGGATNLNIFRQVSANFDSELLATVGSIIETTVDFEESEVQHRTCIKPGFDAALDEQKRLHNGVESLLREAANELAKDIPADLPSTFNVVYFPQIGFLIAMPKHPDTGSACWQGSEEDVWSVIFATESMVYYKSSAMREMDEHFGNVYSNICGKSADRTQLRSLLTNILRLRDRD